MALLRWDNGAAAAEAEPKPTRETLSAKVLSTCGSRRCVKREKKDHARGYPISGSSDPDDIARWKID